MPAGARGKEPVKTPAEAVWQVGGDVTPSPREVEMMALVLEGRHGRYAADVAEFFSSFHASNGDAGRSWAWAGVAETVRRREKIRISHI